LVVTLVICS